MDPRFINGWIYVKIKQIFRIFFFWLIAENNNILPIFSSRWIHTSKSVTEGNWLDIMDPNFFSNFVCKTKWNKHLQILLYWIHIFQSVPFGVETFRGQCHFVDIFLKKLHISWTKKCIFLLRHFVDNQYDISWTLNLC